jgi:hypothetical protein
MQAWRWTEMPKDGRRMTSECRRGAQGEEPALEGVDDGESRCLGRSNGFDGAGRALGLTGSAFDIDEGY